ncbi:hypothetical protein ACFW1A_38810, partial [Kitasatospora sp. NPDC058965]
MLPAPTKREQTAALLSARARRPGPGPGPMPDFPLVRGAIWLRRTGPDGWVALVEGADRPRHPAGHPAGARRPRRG